MARRWLARRGWLTGLLLGTLGLWPGSARAQDPVLPDTPAGHRLRWALEALQRGVPDQPDTLFAPSFLQAVSAEGLRAALTGVAGQTGGLALVRLEHSDSLRIVAVTRTRQGEAWWRVMLAVEPAPPHRIAGLLYQPAEDLNAPPLTGWAALDSLLDGFHGTVAVAVWEVGDSTLLRPMYRRNAERVLALGSTFKLWVLGALGRLVAEGGAAWDEVFPVRDSLKSLPSGQLQNEPDGTPVTLREHARLMISISDNTATDHLLARVGRDRVEWFMEETSGDPARNRPFLSTREIFQLKLAAPPDLRRRYAEAGEEERRRLLADTVRSLIFPAAPDFGPAPVEIERIEWFASPDETCRLIAAVDALGRRPGLAPVGEALTLNPGRRWDRDRWTRVAFKGGSEPGVLNVTWLLDRADGRRFCVSLGWNDPARAVPTPRAMTAVAGLAGLLEQGVPPAETPPGGRP